MKRTYLAVCLLVCVGLYAQSIAQESPCSASTAQQTRIHELQGEMMKCSAPKYLLIADVDQRASIATAFSTLERHDPKLPDVVVSGFHHTLKLSDFTVTNARRVKLDPKAYSKLMGRLVVLAEGKTPLSAAYLSLFREDVLVFTPKAQ